MAAHLLFQAKFYDDALSRSYYAVFFAAKAALTMKGIEPKRHNGVVSNFNLHFVKTGLVERELGKILSLSKEDRELGEYDDFFVAAHEEVERQLQSAEVFLKGIERLVNLTGQEFQVQECPTTYGKRMARRKKRK